MRCSEGCNLFTGREIYLRISTFWIKIFSVAFGMGVVSGIVMPFQFGTNWSRYSDATANVLAPLLAYEGLTAFFLEAAFLGVLLFGRKLVPPWAHFVAALMVAFGTLFSSFWILAANSWMQTPAGYEIVDGRFFPKDWLADHLQPILSLPARCIPSSRFYITTGFVVLGVGAYLIRDRTVRRGRAHDAVDDAVAADRARAAADLHRRPAWPQHARASAGQARGDRGASGRPDRRIPLTLFAIPDEKAETNRFAIEIP